MEQTMKKVFIGICTVAFTLVAQANVAVSSDHTPIARELTLVRLNQEIREVCPVWYTFGPKCRKMRALISELYLNKDKATAYDLQVLTELQQLGLSVGNQISSLYLQISETRKIFQHVLLEHDGNWENPVCGPKGSS